MESATDPLPPKDLPHKEQSRRLPLLLRFFQVFESLGVLLMLAIVLLIMAVITPNFFLCPPT